MEWTPAFRNLIAQIIDQDTMDGKSERGNLAVAEVLDKADEILEEVTQELDLEENK